MAWVRRPPARRLRSTRVGYARREMPARSVAAAPRSPAPRTAAPSTERWLRSGARDDLQRARGEDFDLIVGDAVGRHPVHGAADRSKKDFALERLGSEPAREINARRIDFKCPDHAES